MKYSIISINEDRAAYKEVIRQRVPFEEIHVPATNGYSVDLSVELEKRGLFIKYPGMFSAGEVGVWISTFDNWVWSAENDEELIVFEDDAIPSPTFEREFNGLYQELPKDYDFMCLWVPENQYLDYIYDVEYNEEGQPTHVGPNRNSITSKYNFGAMRLAKVYNGYGNVAQLYSPQGARFFVERARQAGLYTPVDCYLYQEAHAGRCTGYGPKPNRAKVVTYDWQAETTVHGNDRI